MDVYTAVAGIYAIIVELQSRHFHFEDDLVERWDCRRELGDGQYYRAPSFAQSFSYSKLTAGHS